MIVLLFLLPKRLRDYECSKRLRLLFSFPAIFGGLVECVCANAGGSCLIDVLQDDVLEEKRPSPAGTPIFDI
jgi:hypothetical protein